MSRGQHQTRLYIQTWFIKLIKQVCGWSWAILLTCSFSVYSKYHDNFFLSIHKSMLIVNSEIIVEVILFELMR